MYDDYADNERQRLIEAELFELAEVEPIKKRGTELRKLIAQRRFILDQRRQGRSVEGIVRILAKKNIHVFEGTARNYIPQIENAIHALHTIGNDDPTNTEIHRMVIERAKASRHK